MLMAVVDVDVVARSNAAWARARRLRIEAVHSMLMAAAAPVVAVVGIVVGAHLNVVQGRAHRQRIEAAHPTLMVRSCMK
jgi:2-methylaconitate cis-trans-isomerase PrpF